MVVDVHDIQAILLRAVCQSLHSHTIYDLHIPTIRCQRWAARKDSFSCGERHLNHQGTSAETPAHIDMLQPYSPLHQRTERKKRSLQPWTPELSRLYQDHQSQLSRYPGVR